MAYATHAPRACASGPHMSILPRPLTLLIPPQVHGLAQWPVEAGPEFVHGRHSVFVRLIEQFGFELAEKEWPDWWYFAGKENKSERLVQEADDEVEKVGL